MSSTSIAQEVLKALAPTLDALKLGMAQSSVAINQLHESLLKQIVELNKEVVASSGRIRTLENQIIQIRNAQKAAPAPPIRNTSSTADENDNKHNEPAKKPAKKKTGMQEKTNNRLPNKIEPKPHKDKTSKPVPPKPETLISAKYPIAEREIIVSFEGNTEMDLNEETADIALDMVNDAITDHQDIKAPPFIRSRFSLNNNLILTTGFTSRAIDYEAYLTIITDSLKHIGPASARVNEKWTKFLVHKVPTRTFMPAVRHDIETNYPSLKLAQTPRWLTTHEQRMGKLSSTIVIALVGTITKKQLGVNSLVIRNRSCQISEYHPHGPWTQCARCQQFGHPTPLCKQEHPTCAVCAEEHTTREHPCKFETCKGGPVCKHPPIKCAVCQAPHKASDPNCPERVKVSPFLRANPLEEPSKNHCNHPETDNVEWDSDMEMEPESQY